jgi:hypothetical protein
MSGLQRALRAVAATRRRWRISESLHRGEQRDAIQKMLGIRGERQTLLAGVLAVLLLFVSVYLFVLGIVIARVLGADLLSTSEKVDGFFIAAMHVALAINLAAIAVQIFRLPIVETWGKNTVAVAMVSLTAGAMIWIVRPDVERRISDIFGVDAINLPLTLSILTIQEMILYLGNFLEPISLLVTGMVLLGSATLALFFKSSIKYAPLGYLVGILFLGYCLYVFVFRHESDDARWVATFELAHRVDFRHRTICYFDRSGIDSVLSIGSGGGMNLVSKTPNQIRLEMKLRAPKSSLFYREYRELADSALLIFRCS